MLKISLLLPVDNFDIENVLKSLKYQSVHHFELIIASNKYDEKIDKLKDEYSIFFYINYLVTNKNYSITELKNLMLLHANYDIISFLSCDTHYSINTIENCISLLSGKKNTILILDEDKNNNILKSVKTDNYFINFKGNDIYFVQHNYNSRANDIEYLLNLKRLGYSFIFSNIGNIVSTNNNSPNEYKEIKSLLKKEIIGKKNIFLLIKYLQTKFKGEN